MAYAWTGLESLESRLLLDGGPIVTMIQINDGDPQRAAITTLEIGFDTDVSAFLSIDDLSVVHSESLQNVDMAGASLTYESESDTATWTLGTAARNVMADSCVTCL